MGSEKSENVEVPGLQPALPNEHTDNWVVEGEPIATWRLTVILAWYGDPIQALESEAGANSKISSIGIGLFLSLMDTTAVATMLSAISDEFGGFRKASWIILAYTLSYVGKPCRLQPLLGYSCFAKDLYLS